MYDEPYIPKRFIDYNFDEEEGLTKQSFKDECDINHILRKYQTQGVLTHVNNHSPRYHDVSGIDFANAIETATRAQQMFDELPSKLRKRFGHDPGQFLDFVQSDDPSDIDAAIDLGLRPKSDRVSSDGPVGGTPTGSVEQPPAGQQEPESPAE